MEVHFKWPMLISSLLLSFTIYGNCYIVSSYLYKLEISLFNLFKTSIHPCQLKIDNCLYWNGIGHECSQLELFLPIYIKEYSKL